MMMLAGCGGTKTPDEVKTGAVKTDEADIITDKIEGDPRQKTRSNPPATMQRSTPNPPARSSHLITARKTSPPRTLRRTRERPALSDATRRN
jgi:hypothetical protein